MTDVKAQTITKFGLTPKEAETVSEIVDRMLQPVIIDMESVIDGYKQTLKEQLNRLPKVLSKRVPSLRNKENSKNAYNRSGSY